MLSQIIIKKLFNLYDYDIDLTNTDRSKLKFITAPNGFGKTTLLDFIYSVMTGNYKRMYDIPFDEFSVVFDRHDCDGMFNMVTVKNTIYQAALSEDSDEMEDESIKLDFFLKEIHGGVEKIIEQFCMTRGTDGIETKDGESKNMDMFFVAQTCHYITDDRLMKKKTEVLDETLYMKKSSMKVYADGMKKLLAENENDDSFNHRLEIFKGVIERCDFANKYMEVDRRFGIRFVSKDELETKLLLDDLSSGEKHMIIQAYEILFSAQSGTLVMIDEPELSLHMMWQMNYLKNLSEMIEARDFQCIVATHSPQIFNSLWSKSVDLYSLSEQE